MYWIVLFVATLIVGRRIPKILHTPRTAFPDADEATYRRWRSRSLGATFVFLAFTIVPSIGLLIVAQTVAQMIAEGKITPSANFSALALIAILAGGVVWALIWGIQAWRLSKELMHPTMPPSFYPRPNQPMAETGAAEARFENTTPEPDRPE
ncbi:MAG TPA: hypothetical protein VMI31_01745 [Fimbriimonadaceae bacterium]|nr:hypothetical protein [Fimbriimonadaceae bacterium]